MTEQTVTPWEVNASDQTGIDYAKLTEKFGCQLCDKGLIERFEKVINRPAHHLLRRGIFFAHRDLEMIITAKEKNLPIYLYTGRGPSSEALHVGHLVPFIFLKWLQEVLDCPIVIQITDDEKFLFKENLSVKEVYHLGEENSKDIIAVGFKPEKTFIFRNLDYMASLYPVALELMKRTTFNQVKGIFGFNDSTNIGCISFPAIQGAPAFGRSFPKLFGVGKWVDEMKCLVPYAIDQDPYFRMCRDLAPKINCSKPASIISKFIPSLKGAQTKMSSTAAGAATAGEGAIFLTDSPKQVKNKINKYAFSGGKDTAEEQRKFGANLEVDVSFQYLKVFLEDDLQLQKIGEDYQSGKLLTGEVKLILINRLNEIIEEHKIARKNITQEILDQFYNPDRPLLRKAIQQQAENAAPAQPTVTHT